MYYIYVSIQFDLLKKNRNNTDQTNRPPSQTIILYYVRDLKVRKSPLVLGIFRPDRCVFDAPNTSMRDEKFHPFTISP